MTRPVHAVQLYTLRSSLKEDLGGTLKRVAEIGYEAVELYRIEEYFDAYKSALEKTGLRAVSAHASLIEGEARAAIQAAVGLGVRTLIEPRIAASRWTSRADIEDAAAQLSAVADQARQSGVTVGYHNHHEEFAVDIDGTTGLEIFANAVSEDVVLEVDTFWAEVGGVSAPALLSRLGDRVKFLHVKDGLYSTNLTSQTALGEGQMPLAAILAAAPNAARIAELDDFAGDMFTAVEESFKFLSEVDR